MATFRCLSCGGVYVSPQEGVRYFHTCGPGKVDLAGTLHPFPNPRDENLVQETPGGPVRMKRPGAGRELISKQDELTDATLERVGETIRLISSEGRDLFEAPAIGPSPLPEEDPNANRPEVRPGAAN